MVKRSITTLLLLPAATWWILFSPTLWFSAILFLLGLVLAMELVNLLQLPGSPAMYIALFAVACIGLFYGWHPLKVMACASLFWVGAFFVFSAGGVGVPAQRLAIGQWMLFWLLMFLWSMQQLRLTHEGALFLFGACCAVWASDSFAYLIGKRWGRRKLCPRISPGKSVVGLGAALAFGPPVAAIAWHYALDAPFASGLAIGAVVVLAGVIGDLQESLCKRLLSVKDSGRWLPGHGGVLDRVDALMTAIPIAAIFWEMA